MPSMKLIS